MSLKLNLLLCIILFGCNLLNAQAKNEFAKGKIIPSVACLDDKDQTYALYLPSNYDISKKWPIIIGFSNAARGIDPVTLCSEAAEKFGFIVVGSNNTKNGPAGPILKAFDAIKKEIGKRFSIDTQRIYSLGFSGGSSVALQLASQEPDYFCGVIACALFVTPSEIFKNKNLFIYGIVGDKDFAYPEYKKGGKILEINKTPYWIEVFKGNHEWPPKELIFDAIEMFDYLYQKTGEDKGKTQADKIIKKKMVRIEQMLKENAWEHASFEIDNLLRNFENNSYAERLKGLRKKLDAKLN